MRHEWHSLIVQGIDRILVVTLYGRFGIETPDLFPQIRHEPSLCAENIQRFDALVLNLSEAEWINSEGIAVCMVFISRFIREDNRSRIGFVHGGNRRHQHLLEVLRLAQVFPQFTSVDDALRHFQRQGDT